MHVHINHCFCTDPCWGGDNYWSRYMVVIERHVDYRHKPKLEVNEAVSVALDPNNFEEDWRNLLELKDVWDQKKYEDAKKRYAEVVTKKRYPDMSKKEIEEQVEHHAKFEGTLRNTPHLKQEVIDWLNENVADNKQDKDQPQGWCMGTEFYRGRDQFGLTLWFYRRGDAMKFIKEWSSHTKPTTYFDYFKEIYKELIDGKLTKC